jgi:peptide/nickel transport system substrate-binding protein
MKPMQVVGRARLLLFILIVFLASCGPSTTPAPTATVMPTETPPTRTVTPLALATPTPSPTPSVATAIIVGLLQNREPDTLWILGNLTDEQRLVQDAVWEPAITTLDYDYQPVLFEKIPTLENGGALITRTNVPIDPATGAITTTDTGVYTKAPQMQLTFQMRKDIYWSDGQPVKASDSVFGFNVACSPESGYARFARCDKVERYEALGDRTIHVAFKANVMELDYFTYYWDFMPEHAWSHYTPAEMATTEQVARRLSPSYGPYMVQDWTPGESITLVRNPYYVFHGKDYPIVDKIIFKFVPDSYSLLSQLLAGQVDLVERLDPQELDPKLLLSLEENNLLRLYPQLTTLWENIVINLNDPADLTKPHPVLSDLRVRQALAYGTNREAMAQIAYLGLVPVMNSWIPAIHWAYPGDDALTLYPYDPQKASSLLEEAGWIQADDGYRYKDGQRLELKLYIQAGQPLREVIVQQFVNAIEPLGMVIDVERVREADWYGEQSPLIHRTFDLIEFAWVTGMEPDGQVSYTCAEIPTPENDWHGQNYGGWCNNTATVSLLGAANELHRDRRAEMYRIAQQQFTADVPAIPLFSRLDFYAAAPGLVNLKLNPTEDPTWNCWEWSLLARR